MFFFVKNLTNFRKAYEKKAQQCTAEIRYNLLYFYSAICIRILKNVNSYRWIFFVKRCLLTYIYSRTFIANDETTMNTGCSEFLQRKSSRKVLEKKNERKLFYTRSTIITVLFSRCFFTPPTKLFILQRWSKHDFRAAVQFSLSELGFANECDDTVLNYVPLSWCRRVVFTKFFFWNFYDDVQRSRRRSYTPNFII